MTTPETLFLVFAVLCVVALIVKSEKENSSSEIPLLPLNSMEAEEWTLGPVTPSGERLSVGVPLHPLKHPEGLSIPIPSPDAQAGHVHYVYRGVSEALTGKAGIELQGRIEAAPGVALVPTKFKVGVPAQITAYLRRAGDNFSGVGGYEFFRWYCTAATITGLGAGEFAIRAPFDAVWTPVSGLKDSRSAPKEFAAALAYPYEIGFVLGGGDGYGHGVYATGPAQMVLTSYRVV